MGIGIVAMGAITIKTLRGRPQEYQPMDIHRKFVYLSCIYCQFGQTGNQPEDLEMAEQNSEPSWEERGGHGQLRNDSIGNRCECPYQFRLLCCRRRGIQSTAVRCNRSRIRSTRKSNSRVECLEERELIVIFFFEA